MTQKQYLDSESIKRWNELIEQAKKIVVFGHVSPDGDAMGSTLAMAAYLKNAGKDVKVVVPSHFPDFLAWLPGSSEVLIYEYTHRDEAVKAISEADLQICLDFCGWSRLESLGEVVRRKVSGPTIVVDHHLNPEPGADLLISDPKASSTCEMLFFILLQLYGIEAVSFEMAQCLYCGMMTDTGGFTFNSNRSEIFYLISLLLDKGIDKDEIFRQVYHTYTEQRLRLEGYVISEKMVCFPELHAAVYTLTRDEMKRFQFRKGDAEGLVNKPLQIKGINLSIALREDTEQPLIRVSLRSVGDIPCNKMSEDFFNGGGHKNASGGSLAMTIDEAMEQTKKALSAYKQFLV